MKATDELTSRASGLIERVLQFAETAANRLETASRSPQNFSCQPRISYGFCRWLPPPEEEVSVHSHGGTRDCACKAPTGVMLAEHELGRQYTRALTSAAQGDAKPAIQRQSPSLSRALAVISLCSGQHIFKEDISSQWLTIDSPKGIPWSGKLRACRTCRDRGGVHEKYLRWLRCLT